MSSLALYVLAAMFSWVDPSTHASFEPREVTVARYESIASDIALVSEESPVVDGDASHTALVLASIASYESSYAARVDDCTKTGGSKSTRAYSIWQLQVTRGEACGSRLAAARIARQMVEDSLLSCRAEPLAVYAVGRCEPNAKARYRLSRAKRWWISNIFDIGGQT